MFRMEDKRIQVSAGFSPVRGVSPLIPGPLPCWTRSAAAVVAIALALCACSPKRIIVNKIGNALASGGPSPFDTDDDPDLVGDALPFALKMMETLLAQSPSNPGLLLAATSGFTQYSYVYVGQKAERVVAENVEESNVLRARSRRLWDCEAWRRAIRDSARPSTPIRPPRWR
jgi:hypothetical protein